ncbi:hypothetical protein [Methylocystis sp.]|uniref:hypothetical protein n=1 Tax=Methylocystis sp. TaxID=1911079 RepID=UPI003DA5A45A
MSSPENTDLEPDVCASLIQAPLPSPATVATMLEELCAEATDETDRAAYQRARRALAQAGGGRPPIDDAAALYEVREKMAAGRLSLRAAILHVGRARAPYALAAFERRMFRKFSAAKAVKKV